MNPVLAVINAIGFVLVGCGVLALLVAVLGILAVAIAALLCLPFYHDDWRSVPGAMIPGGDG
ncbi:MAG TPA: hypothetical protein VGM20_04215 [Gemmatimonadales bacterium]|jgi:hypothetical protein